MSSSTIWHVDPREDLDSQELGSVTTKEDCLDNLESIFIKLKEMGGEGCTSLCIKKNECRKSS